MEVILHVKWFSKINIYMHDITENYIYICVLADIVDQYWWQPPFVFFPLDGVLTVSLRVTEPIPTTPAPVP